jgi:transposase
MTTSPLSITNEQINSLPLLFGILEDMGVAQTLDASIRPHGHWQGASVGTLVVVWLCHILQERDHRLVSVRQWVQERATTWESLLGTPLRDTDCTDDRLANVLSMLAPADLQAQLDTDLVRCWVQTYALPTERVRLDSTSVTVYHDTHDPKSLLQHGHSKDHRPDLLQFKAMLSSLDPLGMPLCAQMIPGNRADDGLYVPAYETAVSVLGRRDLLFVGDSKMPALRTRAHLADQQSAYLCSYRAPVYLRDEERLSGLLWLLCLALRVLTLVEYRVRTALSEQEAVLVGLNPASPSQATAQPTTERLIGAFRHLTLTCLSAGEVTWRHPPALSPLQQQILALLGLPPDLYEQLGSGMENCPFHLRE